MKRTILLLILSFAQTLLFAQHLESRKMIPMLYENGDTLLPYDPIEYFIHSNWSIVVDNALVVTEKEYSYVRGRFILEYNNNPKRDTIILDIEPGTIGMDLADYEFIMAQEDLKEIYFALFYKEICSRNRTKRYYYEIPIYKEWLNFRYVVVYIYNTDKKEIKPYYNPLPGKNYNYDIIYEGSGKLVGLQKKLTKKQKNACK